MITGARGTITGETEAGWVADLSHPLRLTGVTLPKDALCLTKEYPSNGSRTRISNRHCPDLPVTQGDPIVAIVDGYDMQETGRRIDNPAYWSRHRGWDEPRTIPEVEPIGGTAVRWGLRGL